MTLEMENVVGLFVRDKQTNAVLKVLQHGEVTLGRVIGNDLVINHPTVSKQHARIYTYLMVSYIEDLGSTNGTYINDKRIEKQVIRPGDVIRLGEYELLLDVREPNQKEKEAPPTLAESGL